MRRFSYSFRLKPLATVLLLAISVCCATAQTTPAEKQGRSAPPVWTPTYNADQGPLPDTSNWKVIRQEKSLVVRIAPGANWSQYREVVAGEVRYTGSEIKLKPRQIAEVTDLLQTRMSKDLKRVKLTQSRTLAQAMSQMASSLESAAKARVN